MKRILLLTILSVFVFGIFQGNLFSSVDGFVDLGSNPIKVKVKKIVNIDIESGYKFENWSGDGKYFAAISTKSGEYKTNIYLLNGNLVKKIEGMILHWSYDSKKILCLSNINSHFFLFVYDIKTWDKKQLPHDVRNQDSVQFYKDNSHLLFLRGEKDWVRNIRKSEILKWNIETNAKEVIYTYEGCEYINSDLRYIGNGNLIFTRFYCPKNKDDFREALYILNLSSKTEKKLCENSPSHIYKLNSGKIIIDVLNRNFIDVNGNSYGTINAKCVEDIAKKIYNKKTECIYGGLFPNGKLYLHQIGTLPGGHLYRMKDSFIYIYNFHNVKKRLNLPDPTEYISISPVGNSFLAKIDGKIKMIVLERRN